VDAKQVADAVAGKSGHGVDAVARVAGVSIDSRTIRRGIVHRDSWSAQRRHDYVPTVMESGALAQWWRAGGLALTQAGYRTAASPCADTLTALHELARAVRKGLGQENLRITGSVGKDHYEEILAHWLGAKLRVLKNEGNFNNEYGCR